MPNRFKTPQDVIDAVCVYYMVTLKTLKSTNRTRVATEARHVAMFIMYKALPITLAEIARMFNRHLGSVGNAVAKVKYRMTTGAPLTLAVAKLTGGGA